MENVDNEPQHISCTHENFVRDFIQTYKENRILWDKKHSKYKSRDDRDAAFDLLVRQTCKYFPEANLDFVKTKIDSIRGAFRREHKKVLESKKKAKTDEDIYVPSLWYYNLLLFIVGEEIDEQSDIKDISKHIYSWSKHHTIILIELLKKYPILYSLEPPPNGSKTKRTRAYRDITNELITEVGRHFEAYEVKNKINTLKQQFRRECRDRGNKDIKRSSKLWCYDLLIFLKDSTVSKKCEVNNKKGQDISDDDTENLWINNCEVKSDTDGKDEQIDQEEYQDDIFDTIGKHVAMKLRDMSDDQRVYAENLINEILYQGLMGNLTADSCISFIAD